MTTTVKPLPSVKTATASVKCTMAAEESYKVWYQMMRDMADKDIKRLKHELHQSKANTRNVPKNMLDDALDALKRITEVDVSGRNAWTASNIMKKIARGVLDE